MSNNNNNRQFYTPQEETGFTDPLGNCNDFNLLNFINSGEDTPIDSPAMEQRYFHAEQSTSRQPQPVIRQQPLYYNPVVTIPQQIPNQQLKVSPGSEYQASNSTYSAASSSNAQGESPVNGQISPHDQLLQFQSQPNQFILDDIQQENLPLELYLNGNEDLSDLQLNDFPLNQQQTTVMLGQKRRRMDPVDEIKCEEAYTMVNVMNNNQCMLSNSSTNSSINNENINFDTPVDGEFSGPQRMIKFTGFQPQQWSPLYDANQCQLPLIQVSLVADKGFSYSNNINCFVNQKKNHLQLTMMLKTGSEQMPKYAYNSEMGLKEVRQFKLDVCGIKAEMPSSEIQMRQSLSNRKTVPYAAEPIDIDPLNATKKTCYRLHLSDVTGNNNRKNNKQINPAQRYFHLVIKLVAECADGTIVLIQAHASDRFICRASNPKTFEEPQAPTTDSTWQRANNTIHYSGPVAIGTDKPINGAQLTVHGNIVSTGQHTRPSDRRVKEDIIDIDTKEAMERINKLRLVEYNYKPEMAQQWGMSDEDRHRVGVIAQELAEVIPEAVRNNGEFLTVDDSRIFMESVAAQQELHKISGCMGTKVDNVEEMTVKLAKYMRKYQKVGSMASGLSDISALLAKQAKVDAEKERDAGQDNKSFVSQSHLSLMSSAAPSIHASQIGSASQYGRYYSRKGRLTSRDSNLCNSRLTQATMVGLVVVMSICLVAMCALYVMDWYQRTYVYAHTQFPRPDPIHEIGNLVELTNFIPPAQPLVRPLLSGCVGALGALCPVYCCGAGKEGTPPTTTANPTTPGNNTVISLQDLLDEDGDNSSPKLLHSGVQIKLTDLNIMLDAKYCVDKSCNARKGIYNLYVPISVYLPTIPLNVKFSADSDMQIDACGQYAKLHSLACKGDTEKESKLAPSIHKLSGNTFELSAGRFLQSAYRFRVGYTSDACAMPDEQRGRSFDEYNLIFYRKCNYTQPECSRCDNSASGTANLVS